MPHFFFKYLTQKKDEEEEQLTQGLWMLVWPREAGERWTKSLTCFQEVEEGNTAVMYRCSVRNDTTFLMRRQRAPNSTMLPSLGIRRARIDMYEKNDLALQLFFSFFFTKLLRFDLNALCVVLYFHAKILLYLNVFILLNVFIIP